MLTNADKLRCLKEEEMAAWLSSLYRHYCPDCPAFTITSCPVFLEAVDRAELEAQETGQEVSVEPEEENCRKRVLAWLNQEIE